MSEKRPYNLSLSVSTKKRRSENISYFQKTLQESGLMLTSPPEKCVASKEIVYIEQNVHASLKSHTDYPDNVDRFMDDFKTACQDRKVFEHYLNFNVVQTNSYSSYQSSVSQSVVKILLNVTLLQSKIIEFIFDVVMEAVDEPIIEPWVKIILETLLRMNSINNPSKLSTKLTDLLEVSSVKSVRLEVISAIPDLIGNQEHDSVAATLCRVLSDDQYLIPSIVDCLTYLCISDEQFDQLQNIVLKSLTPSNSAYYSNFIKFLLTQTRPHDVAYEETIQGLRKALAWSSLASDEKVIATSQVLTAATLRSYLISSKPLAKAAFTVLAKCKEDVDCKPIDIILFLILYSTSDEKKRLVETAMKKLIKLKVLKEELLNEAFDRYKPIIKEYLIDLLNLSNAFLRTTSEPLIQKFASHMYMVMITELSDCRGTVVVDLLTLVTTDDQLTSSTLNILNSVATKDVNLLQQQSNQILTLLDAKDSTSNKKIKEVMDLVCALAFGVKNSSIRSDVDIIISKALGSSALSTKVQGIYAGIYAVKYLTKGNGANETELTQDNVEPDSSCLPSSDLREAAKIIERINRSTEHFPSMIITFYQGLYEIIKQATDQNMIFLRWLSSKFTNGFCDSFIIKDIDVNTIGDIKVAMKYCLNADSELEEPVAIDIAGLTLQGNRKIETLSSFFQLVSILNYKVNTDTLEAIDALLGCSIVLPNEDLYSIKDKSASSIVKILDCNVHCVNWIRELLNAFSMLKDDEDDVLPAKIFQRIVHLRQIETEIEHILMDTNLPYKPPTSYSYNGEQAPKHKITSKKKHAAPETSTSHQTLASTSHGSNSVTVAHDIVFRPLNLSLFNLLRFDLTEQDGQETKLTFSTLTYLLCHLNNSLKNVLARKKNNFYNSSDAKHQAQAISKLVSKLAIDHMNVILPVLQCDDVEEEPFSEKITESCQCLEQIYNLLTIYFGWFEFRNDHQTLLKESLRIVAKADDETIPVSNLISIAIKNFQKHEKYCISLPTAMSLMELLKALQEHYTGESEKRTLAQMAHKFLSQQWKTPEGDFEKGIGYNKSLEVLTKVYLTNIELADFRVLVNSLARDVKELREKTNTLNTLRSINKSNLSVLLQFLPFPLYNKIKTCIDEGVTNEEHVELWQTVATTLKEMCDIVSTAGVQHTPLAYLKTSIQILNLFLSKGFPILKIEFNRQRETILDTLKEIHENTKLLKAISEQCGRSRAKSKRVPAITKIMIDFDCKIKNLLESNKCMDAIGRFAVGEARSVKRNPREAEQDACGDITQEDSDEYLGDDTIISSDVEQMDSVGLSQII